MMSRQLPHKLAILTNECLNPRINWSTLGPPVTRALIDRTDAVAVRPPAGPRGHTRTWRRVAADVRSAKSLFWMQLAARPEWPLMAAMAAAPFARRSAYVLDAWPYTLPRLALFAQATRLSPCFIAMREAADTLTVSAPKLPVVHLPFAADLDVFAPREADKDIFAFSMGRSHAPLHHALTEYCKEKRFNYVVSTGGEITDESELGRMVARSRYFVVTPPDLDHPERAGGFSPLVMRYLEGLAAGARLLGTLPRSGEFEAILPRESILEVEPDGSDLAAKLAWDDTNDAGFAASAEACWIVRAKHGWEHRAQTIIEVLDL